MTATAIPPAFEMPEESDTIAGPLIDVYANLLPVEIVASRRLNELKQRLLIGLAALVAVLMLIFVFSWLQTASAHHNLSSAKKTGTNLQNQQQAFAPLVTAQTDSAAIQQALQKLMVGDLSWPDMIARLAKAGGHGVTITEVNGTLNSGAVASSNATGAGIGVLNQSGHQPVGSMTIDGTAPDKNSVAAFVDSLTAVPGLAAPLPASVTTLAAGHQVQFSVNVIITSDALGGRFATTATGGH